MRRPIGGGAAPSGGAAVAIDATRAAMRGDHGPVPHVPAQERTMITEEVVAAHTRLRGGKLLPDQL
jgi:hypothetical protein